MDSVLIANRGEIACRIARTCRRMGLRSIAVYSDADREARHAKEADEAVRIGPADAGRSYLDPAAIVRAAKASRASAVHPGYGFLSERVELAELCERHGIVWIGPRAEVIARMGSKIESKRIAMASGVPVVPGYYEDDQDPLRLLEAASRIGFPVMIKASAGGGGKGMRRVDDASQFPAQLEVVRREALRAFGDERVLIEALVERPRHLEVQIAGDRHGHLIHLFERECSIQRNHQKIIEEAPAAFLVPEVRERLLESALRLGRAIGYDSLGTVEFLLPRDGDTPCFLELNTRLQVEHTVTEQITGLDLVEWQIRFAFGDALPVAQDDVRAQGWAIEARINSEDPARGYRPEPGIVKVYSEFRAEGVRVDSGIEEGSVVSLHYDSLLAKVIGYGATRAVAARRLDEGLAKLEVGGLVTNQSFLRDILSTPDFLETPLGTDFIARNFPSGWRAQGEIVTYAALVAALATLFPFPLAGACGSPWEDKTGFRLMKAAGCRGRARMMVRIEGETEMAVDIAHEGDWLGAAVGTESCAVAFRWIDPRHVELRPKSGPVRRFVVSPSKGGHSVWYVGSRFECLVEPRLEALARVDSEEEQGRDAIVSPMPGLVAAVNVTAGERVARGSQVAVIEAMKLVFHLQADIDGHVRAVLCAPGDVVVSGQRLLEIDPV